MKTYNFKSITLSAWPLLLVTLLLLNLPTYLLKTNLKLNRLYHNELSLIEETVKDADVMHHVTETSEAKVLLQQ